MKNVALLCPTWTTLMQNNYKQPSHLILSDGMTLALEEGTTQGDPIAIAIYVPLSGDIIGAGKVKLLKKGIASHNML